MILAKSISYKRNELQRTTKGRSIREEMKPLLLRKRSLMDVIVQTPSTVAVLPPKIPVIIPTDLHLSLKVIIINYIFYLQTQLSVSNFFFLLIFSSSSRSFYFLS